MSGSIAPSVLVACDDLLLLDEVIRYLEEIPQWRLVAPARSAEELVKGVELTMPDYVLMAGRVAVDLAREPFLGKATQIETGYVVFDRQESIETLRAALRLEAKGFLLWPQERLQLKPIVERGVDRQETATVSGNLHCVWGPKGGAGSSVIAAHLAACLSKLHQEVILIDLDLDNADQISILQADNAKSVADLLRVGDEVTPDMVRSVASLHEAGFRLVASPGKFGETALLKPPQLARVLNAAREVAGHVVADLPSGLSDLNLSVLEDASSIVLVLTPDLLGLRRAREAVRVLRSAGVDGSHIHGVLNQAAGADIAPKDVEQVLEIQKVTRIRADFQIYRMVNRGQLSPRCNRMLLPLARRLGNLQSFSSVDATPAERGGSERRRHLLGGRR